MRRVAAACAAAAFALCATPARADVGGATLSNDRSEVSVLVGERFDFTTTVQAPADRALTGAVAHLSMFSLDPEVYVDPEDWSESRVRYLPDVPAGGRASVPWSVHAVNDGSFVLVVSLSSAQPGAAVAAAPGVRAEVASQRSINPGGIVPIAVGAPAVLSVAIGFTRLRRRRLR